MKNNINQKNIQNISMCNYLLFCYIMRQIKIFTVLMCFYVCFFAPIKVFIRKQKNNWIFKKLRL